MAEPIVVIAIPMKIIAEPVEERLVRVSPMPANAQDRDVERDERVNERRELKSPIRRRKNDEAGDPRKNFQPPSEAIVRINSRPNENDRNADQKRDVRFSHFDELASSTAKLIAAIMLSGFAIFFPAISNAVP
jgi:hypothetical protein